MNIKRDTYEFDTIKEKFERIEWDDIWCQDANITDKKRVLVIGDSISRGYRNFLINKIGEEYAVDSVATSKAVDNEQFITLLEYMKAKSPEYEIIQFNNGLHGWHLSYEEYENCYLEILGHIKRLFPIAKLFLALTTPVREMKNVDCFDARNTDVIKRNHVAKAIAKEMNAEMIDLYHIMEKHPDYYCDDGVHFLEEGYVLLADECVKMWRA